MIKAKGQSEIKVTDKGQIYDMTLLSNIVSFNLHKKITYL